MVILNSIQEKFHHIAQFLGAFSNSFLPKQSDDSQTAMKWDIGKSALQSQKVSNTYIELSYKDIMLRIKHNDTTYELDLLGVDFDTIKNWIVENLEDFGISAENFTTNLGYKLPTPFNGFVAVDNEDEMAIYTAIEHRNIAQKCLESLAVNGHSKTSEIFVWPHHFDTGMLINKATDDSFEKIIGCGYAIADHICNVPYFYAYAWAKDENLSYTNPTQLSVGQWHIKEDWKGILLPANFTDNITLNSVTSFYNEAVFALTKIL
ncbi:hypothetical protein [Neptunitalea lumnitzerae]|uniref:Uncharacterized protein n=1 Tax=Neptunitalea lumnitzerae TaxID=2965509 RepID=A0ABQ5MHX4_9FLAO|nr:hypothetical protein [Neptunitalea sp. Y10]GLB49013.1 hypothetical protein Y10_13810 [Neptunitalea sp. Y10]